MPTAGTINQRYLLHTKKILFTCLVGFVLLNACGRDKTKNSTAQKAPVDTVQAVTGTGTTAIQAEKRTGETCTGFRNIYCFDEKIGNTYVDSLHMALWQDASNEVAERIEICNGDYCMSWRSVTDTRNDLIFYIFKGDATEYGFDNSQYLVKNGELVYVREFNVEVRDFPTDSSSATWRIYEQICRFGPSSVTIRQRSKEVTHYEENNELLHDVAFTSHTEKKEPLQHQKTDVLNRLFARKKQ